MAEDAALTLCAVSKGIDTPGSVDASFASTESSARSLGKGIDIDREHFALSIGLGKGIDTPGSVDIKDRRICVNCFPQKHQHASKC